MHSTQLPLSIALPFAIVLSIAGPRAIGAQQASSIPRALTLEQAREIARTVAPELTAAREALAAHEHASDRRPRCRIHCSCTAESKRPAAEPRTLRTLRRSSNASRSEDNAAPGARLLGGSARWLKPVSMSLAPTRLRSRQAYVLAVAANRRAAVVESAAGVFAKATQVSRARLAARGHLGI